LEKRSGHAGNTGCFPKGDSSARVQANRKVHLHLIGREMQGFNQGIVQYERHDLIFIVLVDSARFFHEEKGQSAPESFSQSTPEEATSLNVFFFQPWKPFEDGFRIVTGRKVIQHMFHGQTFAPNNGISTIDIRIRGDSIEQRIVHEGRVPFLDSIVKQGECARLRRLHRGFGMESGIAVKKG